MKKFILPILVLGLMVVAMPSQAAIYVDSETGDDANMASGCLEAAPCATFAGSRDLLNTEDTMYLSGTFTEQLEFYSNDSGTAEVPKTISVWPDREANIVKTKNVINVLGTNYINFEGLNITNNDAFDKSGIVLNGTTGSTINNCTIYDIGKRGIKVTGNASDITISNNTIYNTQENGIKLDQDGENLIISGNTLYETGLDSDAAITTQSPVLIEKNIIHDGSYAIIVQGATSIESIDIINNNIYNSSETSIMIFSEIVTTNIQNNTFYESDINQILYFDNSYNGTNLNIKNNIFHLADTSGLIYYLGVIPATFNSDYNLLYAPNIAIIINNDGKEYTFAEWQALGYETNSLNEDPLLTSTTSGSEDLHLQATSPAIDAGDVLTTVTDDINGDTRYWGSAHDIGADEYLYLTTPENLAATKYVYKSTISWDEVTNATSYNIKYGKGASLNGNKVAELTSDDNSKEVTALEHGGRYYWKIQAVNGDTLSEWSETKRMVTNPKKIKKANFFVPKTTREAKKARIKISSLAKRVTGFNILVAKKTGKTYKKIKTVKVSNKSAKNYTYKWVKDLKADSKYRIQIKARRKIGSKTFLSTKVNSKYFTTASE